MLDIEGLTRLAEAYELPLEEVLFIALNVKGVSLGDECVYARMRMNFRLFDRSQFGYALEREELDYFFALAVNPGSEFVLRDGILTLGRTEIGRAIDPEEDLSDLYYFRRDRTCLNFNPNARSACAGCKFCYTARLTPNDEQTLDTADDLRAFFDAWMRKYSYKDLSHLIQISVVTGNYKNEEKLCAFLVDLRHVLNELGFLGKIFYLGSQIVSQEQFNRLVEIQPLGICFSLETFERRDLLRKDKRKLEIDHVGTIMSSARDLGHEVNFSYIVGMEPLDVMEKYMRRLSDHVNKFPTINTFQVHNFQGPSLIHPDAGSLGYFLDARMRIEEVFAETELRPLAWEDYRSLWFLLFRNEPLVGIRTP